MALVDIDRASDLDKIHTKRMLHAFSQICLELIRLQDKQVDAILGAYGIAVMPGPRASIDYAVGAKQILEAELIAANKAAQKSVKAKKKR